MTAWSSCRVCHSATHELQVVTADIRKLIRRAERGANVLPQIKAKQEESSRCREILAAHTDDGPHVYEVSA